MADFQPAVQNTELWEGGYSNHVADSGGETYRGISRNNFPNWNGWAIIDVIDHSTLDQNSQLQALVVAFYHATFWHYDGINDQAVANKIFDLAVNVGQRHAIKIVQLAVSVIADGVYGPATEAAINCTSNLLPSIKDQATNYYEQIVQAHPEDAIFLAGWLRRINS